MNIYFFVTDLYTESTASTNGSSYDSKDDEYWKHYLTTLQIANYLLAPDPDEVAYLNVILPQHHVQMHSKTFK